MGLNSETQSMVFVIAEIKLQEGGRAEFLEEFRKLVPQVQAESGCIEYGPAVDTETDIPAQIGHRENLVTVVEKWESLDALKAHLIAPHMGSYRERVKHLVAGAELRILEPA